MWLHNWAITRLPAHALETWSAKNSDKDRQSDASWPVFGINQPWNIEVKGKTVVGEAPDSLEGKELMAAEVLEMAGSQAGWEDVIDKIYAPALEGVGGEYGPYGEIKMMGGAFEVNICVSGRLQESPYAAMCLNPGRQQNPGDDTHIREMRNLKYATRSQLLEQNEGNPMLLFPRQIDKDFAAYNSASSPPASKFTLRPRGATWGAKTRNLVDAENEKRMTSDWAMKPNVYPESWWFHEQTAFLTPDIYAAMLTYIDQNRPMFQPTAAGAPGGAPAKAWFARLFGNPRNLLEQITSEEITPRPITPTFGYTKEEPPHKVGSWLHDVWSRRLLVVCRGDVSWEAGSGRPYYSSGPSAMGGLGGRLPEGSRWTCAGERVG